MEDIIIVRDVNLEIKKEKILSDINISFQKGKIYGLVGRNGSGKTMLMKCICGFIKPSSGTIIYDNKCIGKDIDFIDDAGIIIETPGFIPYYSGYKNLQLLSAVGKRISKEQIEDALKIVELDGCRNKQVRKYSLGMRQRLGLAQAIMENPNVLILDEPMNGLDNEGVEKIRNILLDLKKKGKTIILVSHNKEDIDILCDNIYIMEHGRIET